MYPRKLVCRPTLLSLASRHAAVPLSPSATPASLARQSAQREQQTASRRTSTASRAPDGDRNGNADSSQQQQQQQQRRVGPSLRPITLLALCIPAGYLLSWYVRRHEQAGGATASPDGFVKYRFVSREQVSSTSAIFTLRPSFGGDDAPVTAALDGLTPGPARQRAVISFLVKQPQLQIARAYSPLPLPVREKEQERGQGEGGAGQEEGIYGSSGSLLPPPSWRELRLLIRREHKGEVSGYLHRLPVGAEVEVRGPRVEYVLPFLNEEGQEDQGKGVEQGVGAVVFLAAGTGIAPAMQVAAALGDEAGADASMHILWACRRRDECVGGRSDSWEAKRNWHAGFGGLLSWLPAQMAGKEGGGGGKGETIPRGKGRVVEELKGLKLYCSSSRDRRLGAEGHLSVDYYVDEEGRFIKPSDVLRLMREMQKPPHQHQHQQLGQTDDEAGRASSWKQTKRLIFVSGPEGFVEHWAGAKEWVDGREQQGALGGILAGMDTRGWDVVKL